QRGIFRHSIMRKCGRSLRGVYPWARRRRDPRARDDGAMKLRLAENFRAIFYAPFYATQALGFYEREGVAVEFVASSTPGDAVARLLDGSIDLTWGGPMRVMQAHDRDPPSPPPCFSHVVPPPPFYT